MPTKYLRLALIIVLLGASVALACKGPQMLAEPTIEGPPGAADMPTATSSAESVYPRPPGPTPYPDHATAYPAQPGVWGTPAYPGAVEPTLDTGDAYPGPTAQGDQQLYPYPEPTQVFVATPTEHTDPLPEGDESASPTPTPNSYPGPVDPTQTTDPYPGAVDPTQTTDPYPGAGVTPPTPIPYPDPGETTPTPTSVFVSTPSLTPRPSLTPTPTGTLDLVGTPTPLPTVTLTSTPMPTPTATPPPPPPWVSSELQATDPDTVELASGRVQLVWFFAFWDGPSQAMAPLVHGLEEQYGERMGFIYLDIDDPATRPFREDLGYCSQPHFFLLDRDGRVLRQWQGYVAVDDLQRAFDAALP